LNRCRH